MYLRVDRLLRRLQRARHAPEESVGGRHLFLRRRRRLHDDRLFFLLAHDAKILRLADLFDVHARAGDVNLLAFRRDKAEDAVSHLQSSQRAKEIDPNLNLSERRQVRRRERHLAPFLSRVPDRQSAQRHRVPPHPNARQRARRRRAPPELPHHPFTRPLVEPRPHALTIHVRERHQRARRPHHQTERSHRETQRDTRQRVPTAERHRRRERDPLRLDDVVIRREHVLANVTRDRLEDVRRVVERHRDDDDDEWRAFGCSFLSSRGTGRDGTGCRRKICMWFDSIASAARLSTTRSVSVSVAIGVARSRSASSSSPSSRVFFVFFVSRASFASLLFLPPSSSSTTRLRRRRRRRRGIRVCVRRLPRVRIRRVATVSSSSLCLCVSPARPRPRVSPILLSPARRRAHRW